MASITHYPTLRSPRIIVPIVTALFGALGTTTGLYAYLSPTPKSSELFGILPPPSLSADNEAYARQAAYNQIHGIRNFTNGVALFATVAFWRFSATCRASPSAAVAVQRVLALTLGIGVLVGLGDGALLARFSGERGVSGEAKALAEEKSLGHAVTMLPVVGLALGWWYL